MIVRINQISPGTAEPIAGWGYGDSRSPLDYAWPVDTRSYQVVVLDHDENGKPLESVFRRKQFRQLIPQVLSALTEPNYRVVIRLDGLLHEQELLPALSYVSDWNGCERFRLSPASKLEAKPDPVVGSVRLLLSPLHLLSLCSDSELGLERSVRLRAICVPEELVNPLLDVCDVDDERCATSCRKPRTC